MTPRSRFIASTTAAIVLSLAGPGRTAHAADDAPWSGWIALPDHYQGDVDIRVRPGAGKKHNSTEIEFRNRYDQKVKVSLRVSGSTDKGEAKQIDRTIELAPGATTETKPENIEIFSVESAAITSVAFDGKMPAPTSAGFRFEAANLENWRAQLAEAQQTLKAAEQAEADTSHQLATVEAAVTTSTKGSPLADTSVTATTRTSGVAVGNAANAEVSDQAHKAASERAAALRKFVADLTARVKAGDIAAALPIPTDPVSLTANTPVSIGASAPKPPAPAPSASIANLANLDDLIKAANEAGKKGDWPKAEEALRTLRANENYTKIRDSERANIEYNYGNALGHNHKAAESEAAYQEAIKLEPKNAAFHDGLAIALANQGKLGEAQAAFQAAVNLEPNNSTYQIHLQQIQEILKRK